MMKIRLLLCIAFILVLVLTGCLSSRERAVENAFKNYSGKWLIYVSKSDYTLTVYDRNLKRIAMYGISYGENPDRGAKLHEGDNRTPEGLYFVHEILSMDADRNSDAYRKLKTMNAAFFRAREGHHQFGKPRVDLGDNAYGPRFYGLSYPNEDDKKRYRDMLEKKRIPEKNGKVSGIGFGIAIHGNNDPDSIGHLASSGCIRMFNNDVVELEQYVQISTPVIIAVD